MLSLCFTSVVVLFLIKLMFYYHHHYISLRCLDKVFQSSCPLSNKVEVDMQMEIHNPPSKHATQRSRLIPVDCTASLH